MNNIEKICLDNGLTIYLYNDKRRHSTFFQFMNLCGGFTKDFIMDGKEYHYMDGLAHILEHYVVECNECGNFIELLGEKQMNTNASTHINRTCFYFETVEDVDFGIKTMLNGIYNVKFDKEKLEKLKNPIYQEIRAKSDGKFYQLNRKVNDNLYNNIKFRDIGGTLEEIKNTTIDDVETFYKAFYQPSNQIIIIAGNFDKDNVLKTINEFYNDLKIEKHDVKKIDIKEKLSVVKKEDILYYKTPLEYVNFSFKIDCSKMSPKEALDLDFYLSSFYNNFFRNSSPLYEKLIKDKVISGGIGCGHFKFDNIITINIGSYTYDVEVFKKSILDTIEKMNSFDEELFEIDKRTAKVNIVIRDENIFSTIFPFIENLVTYNYPYVDTIDDVNSLNYEDYKNTISNLDFSNYTICTIIDNEKEVK